MEQKQLLYDLFQAYYDCRKNKRKTINQLSFELNYEANLIKLRDEIFKRTYEIWKSIAFIVNKPVKREVFAWDFRDRVVHHYIINKINPYFEKSFIYDSYSCREWKWVLFWVKRIQRFLKSASENYKNDSYILKLDIKWFFMSIDKSILHKKLVEFINEKYDDNLDDRDNILYLVEKVVFNNPVKNCIIKWNKNDWQWLPKSKSLFFAWENKGLPIWNLTSQVFANFYLDFLDKFVKQNLKIKCYGRYVDDFVLIHNDKKYLTFCKKEIEKYLKQELKLTIHPYKVYLQYYTKWVLFLWNLNRFSTFGEVIEAIHKYFYYYNNFRIHTSLKMTPKEYEKLHR